MKTAQFVPSLLAGTSRRPLPSEHRELDLLSLSGQALRFDPPPTPASFQVEPEIKDDRTILPLRRPLIRLLVGSKASEHTARALARKFDALRLRPHPFDFPALDTFIKTYADNLGPTAQHWADRQKPASETTSYFEEERLNDENWADAKLSRRVAYLDERRHADPAGARALLESVWSQQNADARFRLLQVLQTGLSADDQPFLTTLEKDRAPRVRTLAARYLARLGANTDNPAWKALLERITRNKNKLQLDVPANLKDQAASRWIREAFEEISFAELTHAFEMPDHSLIEAAGKQDDLLLAFALIATSECRFDLLQEVVERLPNAWERIFDSGLADLGTMSEPDRQHWMEIIAAPYGENLPSSYALWDWLHRIADTTASPALMQTMIRSNLLDRIQSVDATELLAALCPPQQRQALREQISKIDAAYTVNSLALLDILDQMESHG